MSQEKYIIPPDEVITPEDRAVVKGHKSVLLWFTGLSGSGKSTLSQALDKKLHELQFHSYVLDGDKVRTGLSKDLSFSAEDREENIRRIAEVAKLMVDAGLIAVTAFISPFRKDRRLARDLMDKNVFIEVFVKCSIEECEKRDIKGLYKKAREGIIPEFTGISSPYEEPENAEIVLDTTRLTVDECIQEIITYLEKNGYIAL